MLYVSPEIYLYNNRKTLRSIMKWETKNCIVEMLEGSNSRVIFNIYSVSVLPSPVLGHYLSLNGQSGLWYWTTALISRVSTHLNTKIKPVFNTLYTIKYIPDCVNSHQNYNVLSQPCYKPSGKEWPSTYTKEQTIARLWERASDI
jgi:hypothetical protein